MTNHRGKSFRLMAALLFCAVPVALQAASSLLENSPFVPAEGPIATATSQEGMPLELYGIVKRGGEFHFSLYDPATKKSTWAMLNEGGHDFLIRAYDAGSNTVTVDFQGRTLNLALHEAKFSSPIAGPMPQPSSGAMPRYMAPASGPFSQNPAGTSQPSGAVPTAQRPALTPEQVRRIEAEVQRRRAIRSGVARPSPADLRPAPASQ